jgi:hypothetical protein
VCRHCVSHVRRHPREAAQRSRLLPPRPRRRQPHAPPRAYGSSPHACLLRAARAAAALATQSRIAPARTGSEGDGQWSGTWAVPSHLASSCRARTPSSRQPTQECTTARSLSSQRPSRVKPLCQSRSRRRQAADPCPRTQRSASPRGRRRGHEWGPGRGRAVAAAASLPRACQLLRRRDCRRVQRSHAQSSR